MAVGINSWTSDRARCELEHYLDRPVPDDHWQHLVDQLLVDDFRHLDDRTQRLAQAYQGMLRGGELVAGRAYGDRRAEFPLREPWLGADEMTLAAAIGEAMAQRANYRPAISTAHDKLRDGSVQMSVEDARRVWAERFDKSDLRTRQFFRRVAHEFGWHLEDAVIYVLAGWIAPVDPIVASVWITEYPDEHGMEAPRSRARIVLEFDPWVSLDTISEAYWTLRHRLIGPERKPPRAREIEAFRFVVQRLDQQGKPPKGWSALGREWNETRKEWNEANRERIESHPEDDWTYKKEGDIKRAYESIRDRFINYPFPDQMSEAGDAPAPKNGGERGYRQRVIVDPQKREPNDHVPAGKGPRRTIVQRWDETTETR